MSVAAEIDDLLAGHDLGRERAQAALSKIMSGKIDPIQTGAFLIALRAKGESATELAGLADAIRDHGRSVIVAGDGPVVDTCGTGGGAATFNISTAAAFAVAGAGVAVAKHGNRSATSKCGSADVLEELGVAIELPPDAVAECIARAGIGFMFAPAYHPEFRHVVPVRRALAVRTVFNMLGPLANPAAVRRQVIGIADRAYLDRVAQALAELGADRALVVSSDDGMDEISTSVGSEIAEVTPDGIKRWRFEPGHLGIAPPPPGSLQGGAPSVNAGIIRSVLEGEPGPRADIVALNAAAGLLVAGTVETMSDGYDMARWSIESGRAAERLDELVAVSGAVVA